ncbi:MAG: hypothetical protein GY820_04980 [Gammaproteobacteria bacterium]|nr:hypothetical protein [Gammaproteobacteria bacterium]
MTALPGWAGTKEVTGAGLMLLSAIWLAGRLAFWLLPLNTSLVTAGIDCLFLVLLAIMLTPGLLAANNKLYFGVSHWQIGLARRLSIGL